MALTERPGHIRNVLDIPMAAARNHLLSSEWDFELELFVVHSVFVFRAAHPLPHSHASLL